MSEQIARKEQKSNKKLIIIIVSVGFAVIAALVAVIIILLGKKPAEQPPLNNNLIDGKIKYEPGVIVVDKDNLQEEYDKAVNKVKDGYISLNFNNWAESEDGTNFDCYFGNSPENTYDVYYDMYLDDSLSQRIFITGLIPPGSGIDHFESEYFLSPGQYEAVLVLTQVESDHATIHAQTSVQITLVVKE